MANYCCTNNDCGSRFEEPKYKKIPVCPDCGNEELIEAKNYDEFTT